MKFIKKQFNSDSEHQYMIRYNDLLSVNIFFDKEVLKSIIVELSKCDNNTNCLLVDDETIRKYDFPAKMYCAGLFNLSNNVDATLNYLVPDNKLLFLLNDFYHKMEKGISLNNEDLRMLYSFEYDCLGTNEENIKLIRELKNSTIFEIKRIHNYENVKNFSFEATYMLIQENLPANPLNILCVLENAKENSNILNQLNIELETKFQKSKA